MQVITARPPLSKELQDVTIFRYSQGSEHQGIIGSLTNKPSQVIGYNGKIHTYQYIAASKSHAVKQHNHRASISPHKTIL